MIKKKKRSSKETHKKWGGGWGRKVYCNAVLSLYSYFFKLKNSK